MKLLVPVDGSNASVNTVLKAINIAKNYGFDMKLVSVVNSDITRSFRRNENLWRQVDGSAISGRSMRLEGDDFTSKMQEDAEKILKSIIDELDFTGVNVQTEVLFGEPYAQILEIAKKDNVDLIVISNRGFSSIKSFFLGSVAQRVIAESNCPVLVIHSDAKD